MLKMSAVPHATRSLHCQRPDISEFKAHEVHDVSDMELWTYIMAAVEECLVICETNYVCAYAHLQINVNVSPTISQTVRNNVFCTLSCREITDSASGSSLLLHNWCSSITGGTQRQNNTQSSLQDIVMYLQFSFNKSFGLHEHFGFYY